MKKLAITIPNLMTYRNYFYTSFSETIVKEFETYFIIENKLYRFLKSIGLLSDGFNFLVIDSNNCVIKNFLSKLIYRLMDLVNLCLYSEVSNSRKYYVNNLDYKNRIAFSLIKHLRLCRKLEELLPKFFILINKNRNELSGLNPDIFICSLPQSFFDYIINSNFLSQKSIHIDFIFSWDNVTSRGPILTKPNYFLVWNKLVADEIIRFYKFPEDNIFLYGVPQSELIFEMGKSREAVKIKFCEKYGLNPEKPIIAYTTGESKYLKFEPQLIKEIVTELLKYDYQIIIRLHPLDKLENYTDPLFNRTLIMIPSKEKKYFEDNSEWAFSKEDYIDYAMFLNSVDIVLNIASTVSIEALSVRTPVININFMPKSKNYEDCNDVYTYYQTDHYKKILEYKVIPLANSMNELLNLILIYFNNKQKYFKNENYYKLINDFFYITDGGTPINNLVSILNRITSD